MSRVPWSAFFKCAFALFISEGIAIMANYLPGTPQIIVCYSALAIMVVASIGMITINGFVVFMDIRKFATNQIEGEK
jgi:hypothetical protein